MTRLITILLLAAAFCPAALAQDGSVQAGFQYAQTVCAECHAVREGAQVSPNPAAPAFSQIANSPGMTGAALVVILQTPHRQMPDLIVPSKDKADVVAYILSLKR